MWFRSTVLLACSLLSSACLVTTLQPVYDDASLAVDETLPGTWKSDELSATLVIERGEWKAYRVSYAARNTSYALVAYLTKIGGDVFVDLTAEHGVEAVPVMVPVHGVARLQHTGDKLTVTPLAYDYFVAAMRAKELERRAGPPTRQPRWGAVDAALDARQNLMLTSTTDALRAWLAANLKNAPAFRDPITFTR